jgi:hypothetical protein
MHSWHDANCFVFKLCVLLLNYNVLYFQIHNSCQKLERKNTI